MVQIIKFILDVNLDSAQSTAVRGGGSVVQNNYSPNNRCCWIGNLKIGLYIFNLRWGDLCEEKYQQVPR